MILCLAGVLGPDDLATIRGLLAGSATVDGRQTAGWHARTVKRNRQHAGDAPAREAGKRVQDALLRHEVFRAGVLPLKVRPMLFSRYEPGMSYGTHVDDAVMGREALVRSDVSFTVFLSEPADYDGGELVIETTAGETDYKLSAGSVVAYPSTTLHRVAPVTRGVREVAVSWAQSMVRSAERREILFDLDAVRRSIFQAQGKTRDFDLIAKSYANLLRLWADV